MAGSTTKNHVAKPAGLGKDAKPGATSTTNTRVGKLGKRMTGASGTCNMPK